MNRSPSDKLYKQPIRLKQLRQERQKHSTTQVNWQNKMKRQHLQEYFPDQNRPNVISLSNYLTVNYLPCKNWQHIIWHLKDYTCHSSGIFLSIRRITPGAISTLA